MNCKQCGKPIFLILTGLRSYCSKECQKEHRKTYQRQWVRTKVKNGYGNTSDATFDSVTTQNKKKFYYEKVPSEILESYGGDQWYLLAKKHCCNFEVREKEGYCVTLAEPYQTFKLKCSECNLGKALMSKYLNIISTKER
jgi:hypothetical protein